VLGFKDTLSLSKGGVGAESPQFPVKFVMNLLKGMNVMGIPAHPNNRVQGVALFAKVSFLDDV
jgi:hypothetical protein